MMCYNWQQKGWPKATCSRAALRDELKAFETAFKALAKAGKIEHRGSKKTGGYWAVGLGTCQARQGAQTDRLAD